MTDDLLTRLRRFSTEAFPVHREKFAHLVAEGQHPTILFIGCSDSRIVPYMLTGTGPGELFLVRNVGAFVPPYDGSEGFHGTTAAIEFAVLNLHVQHIIVCGHSHCGAIRALYQERNPEAVHLNTWLNLGMDATLPVCESPEALRRTEQRAIALQLERLLAYPMVYKQVAKRQLRLHGWHYVIEDGMVHILDVAAGAFIPATDSRLNALAADHDPTLDGCECGHVHGYAR